MKGDKLEKKRAVGQIHGTGRSFLKPVGWMETPKTGHVDTCVPPLPRKPKVSTALGGGGPWALGPGLGGQQFRLAL